MQRVDLGVRWQLSAQDFVEGVIKGGLGRGRGFREASLLAGKCSDREPLRLPIRPAKPKEN